MKNKNGGRELCNSCGSISYSCYLLWQTWSLFNNVGIKCLIKQFQSKPIFIIYFEISSHNIISQKYQHLQSINTAPSPFPALPSVISHLSHTPGSPDQTYQAKRLKGYFLRVYLLDYVSPVATFCLAALVIDKSRRFTWIHTKSWRMGCSIRHSSVC